MKETNNVTTVTFNNKRQMKRGQCATCDSTKTQFTDSKGCAIGGSFSNSASFLSNYIYRDIILLEPVQNLTKD